MNMKNTKRERGKSIALTMRDVKVDKLLWEWFKEVVLP